MSKSGLGLESIASILRRMLDNRESPLGRLDIYPIPPLPPRPNSIKGVQEMEDEDDPDASRTNPKRHKDKREDEPAETPVPGAEEPTEKSVPDAKGQQAKAAPRDAFLPGLDLWSKQCRDPTTRHDEITPRIRRLTRRRNRGYK